MSDIRVVASALAILATYGDAPVYIERDNSPKGWAEPVTNRPVRAGRNEPCPCGSGKKRKKCNHDEEKQ